MPVSVSALLAKSATFRRQWSTINAAPLIRVRVRSIIKNVLTLPGFSGGEAIPFAASVTDEAPRVSPKILVRNKDLEQSHVCLGVGSYVVGAWADRRYERGAVSEPPKPKEPHNPCILQISA